MEYDRLKVGDRIKTTGVIDLWPDSVVKEGETSEIVETFYDKDGQLLAHAKLDRKHPGLSHWNNKLQVRKSMLDRIEVLNPEKDTLDCGHSHTKIPDEAEAPKFIHAVETHEEDPVISLCPSCHEKIADDKDIRIHPNVACSDEETIQKDVEYHGIDTIFSGTKETLLNIIEDENDTEIYTIYLETESGTKEFKTRSGLLDYIQHAANRYGGWEFIDSIHDSKGNEYGIEWKPKIQEL